MKSKETIHLEQGAGNVILTVKNLLRDNQGPRNCPQVVELLAVLGLTDRFLKM